jgi:hypothetical protein
MRHEMTTLARAGRLSSMEAIRRHPYVTALIVLLVAWFVIGSLAMLLITPG